MTLGIESAPEAVKQTEVYKFLTPLLSLRTEKRAIRGRLRSRPAASTKYTQIPIGSGKPPHPCLQGLISEAVLHEFCCLARAEQ